ncbi:MAG: Asp-tRNA(Asn)/Glu-tRNA(Gln) amidotransferase subunit GatC [Candidatus Pacebacteria bacterium]|nr:Asp-tRNA(Asn)/Glu-tRNA(Gln) amidotransferase subunit GatC [Candidatus Paceibacterota bacterium]
MSLNQDDVKKVARLARIKLPAEAIPAMITELNGIIKFVEQLQEVDTKGVEPMVRVVTMPLPMRDDRVDYPNLQREVLSNAQEADIAGNRGRYFVVPKVVE